MQQQQSYSLNTATSQMFLQKQNSIQSTGECNQSLNKSQTKHYQDTDQYNQEIIKSHQKQRQSSFISAELAYSNDQKKLFDKIGYNKNSQSKEFKNPLIQNNPPPLVFIPQSQSNQDQLFQDKTNNGSNSTGCKQSQISKSFIDVSSTSKSSNIYANQTFTLSQQQFMNPKQFQVEDETMFIRKRTRIDESYYEKRVQTLSKTRIKKNVRAFNPLKVVKINQDGGSFVQSSVEFNGPITAHSDQKPKNAMQRLASFRKKQTREPEDQQFTGIPNISSPSIILGNQAYGFQKHNSRTEANSTVNKVKDFTPNNNDNSVSFIYQDTCDQVNIGTFIRNNKQANSDVLQSIDADGQPLTQVTYIQQQKPFMSKRQNRTAKKDKSNILLDNESSLNSRINNTLFNKKDQSLDGRYVNKFQASVISYDPEDDQQALRNMKDPQFLQTQSTMRQRLAPSQPRIISSKNLNMISNLQYDLRKNAISNEGIKQFVKNLSFNETLVDLNFGCNQISADGAALLFESLKSHKSIVSISLANNDCYKNKNKIGIKGAQALGELLAQNQMIQLLDLADNSIPMEGFNYIIRGLKKAQNLVSLNLSQNDIGSNPNLFTQLLTIFSPSKYNSGQVACCSLEELILSQNQLKNKNIDDLAQTLKSCEKTKLSRLDLSSNKLSCKSLLQIIQMLRSNPQLKLTHLIMDKTQLEIGIQQEQINNFYALQRTLAEYLRSNKSLTYLSLNNCAIHDELMTAIGKGLMGNEKLQTLLLKVQQKKNLWKLQLDMNMIKYVNLVEIEKICKKNKKNSKLMYIPKIQQEIKNYQVVKDPKVSKEILNRQIKLQQHFLKEGLNHIVIEEEAVHSIIKEGLVELSHIDAKTKTLKEIITKQDELISEIDQQHLLKERELKKKIEQEQVLVDRYKEYVREQEKIVQKERQKLQRKKVLRQNCEEEQKMREDLEKIKREQEMMQIIMENYQKEIQRRQTAFEKQNHDENTSNCDQSLIYNNGNCVDEKLNLKLIDKDSDDYMIMSSKTNTKHTLFGLSNKKALRSKNVMKSNEKQQAVNYTTQKQVMDGALLLGDDSYSQNQCVGSNPNDVSNFSKNSTKSKSRRRSSSRKKGSNKDGSATTKQQQSVSNQILEFDSIVKINRKKSSNKRVKISASKPIFNKQQSDLNHLGTEIM
eukprot:403354202